MWCATVGVNAGARQLVIAMPQGFASASTMILGGAGIIGAIAGIGAMTMRVEAIGATASGLVSEEVAFSDPLVRAAPFRSPLLGTAKFERKTARWLSCRAVLRYGLV